MNPWPKKNVDFGLTPDTDNVFHVKEIQDMVNVMQRMIKDGERRFRFIFFLPS